MPGLGSTPRGRLEPAERPEQIATLINSADRYNSQSVEALENRLRQGSYDLLVNLATLKL